MLGSCHVALPAQGKCVTAPTNLVWGSEGRKQPVLERKYPKQHSELEPFFSSWHYLQNEKCVNILQAVQSPQALDNLITVLELKRQACHNRVIFFSIELYIAVLYLSSRSRSNSEEAVITARLWAMQAVQIRFRQMTRVCIWGWFSPQYEIKIFLFYCFLWKYVHWLAKKYIATSPIVTLIAEKYIFKEWERSCRFKSLYNFQIVKASLKCLCTKKNMSPSHS